MEHTPWSYHIGEDYFTIYNSRDVEVLTSPCLPDADAPRIKLIVQAVNSHEALLKGLNDNIQTLRALPLQPQGSTVEISIAKAINNTRVIIANATKEGK